MYRLVDVLGGFRLFLERGGVLGEDGGLAGLGVGAVVTGSERLDRQDHAHSWVPGDRAFEMALVLLRNRLGTLFLHVLEDVLGNLPGVRAGLLRGQSFLRASALPILMRHRSTALSIRSAISFSVSGAGSVRVNRLIGPHLST